MRKKILIATLLITVSFAYSQNFSYGPIIGANYYDIRVKESTLAAGIGSGYLNYGAFVDYRINNNFGIKVNLLVGKTKETDYEIIEGSVYKGHIFNEIELKKIHIQSLLKFDLNGEYNKGVNLQSGIRFSNIIDSESDINQNLADNFHKKTNLGFLLGIGIHFMKDFEIQMIGDYGFTNILDGKNDSETIGIFMNLSYSLDSIINKN
jgi:hypothetical protein